MQFIQCAGRSTPRPEAIDSKSYYAKACLHTPNPEHVVFLCPSSSIPCSVLNQLSSSVVSSATKVLNELWQRMLKSIEGVPVKQDPSRKGLPVSLSCEYVECIMSISVRINSNGPSP